MGDPTRRRIFELVADGPVAVGEVAAQLPVSRPAVSQHLKVLKQAGLVRGEIDPPRVCYCINPETVERLKSLITRL